MKLQVTTVSSLLQDQCSCQVITLEDKLNPQKKISIMVDCGVNQKMDTSAFKKHQRKINRVNLVLLSQASVEFSGGLPYLYNTQMLLNKTLMYAPAPVVDYGFRNFVDQYLCLSNHSKTQPQTMEVEEVTITFNQEPVDTSQVISNSKDAYNLVQRLNFGQKQMLTLGDMNVTITPIRAGKSVGACVWKISVGLFSFVVMTDFSLSRDLHVDVLPVDKLLSTHNNQNHSLVSHRIDYLLINNISTNRDQKQVQSVKNTILEQLKILDQRPQTRLVLSFYPNERVLEGIMAMDQILYEYQEYVGAFRCELMVNYLDIIERARGQTDFLGSALVDWRQQEQNHQTPLDPDYLKQRFLTFRSEKEYEKGVPLSEAKIIFTTFNDIFFGAHSAQLCSLLENEKNIFVFFGQPPSYVCDTLRGLQQQGFKGGVELRQKKQDQQNFLNFQKNLLKKQENLLAPSTVAMTGTLSKGFDSSSEQLGKNEGAQTEESLQFEQMPDPLEIMQVEHQYQIFDIPADHEVFQTAKNQEYSSDQINFSLEVQGKFQPINELFGRDSNGIEYPREIQQRVAPQQLTSIRNTDMMESESENEIQYDEPKDTNVFLLQKIKPIAQIQVRATIRTHNQQITVQQFETLVDQLAPKHKIILRRTVDSHFSDAKDQQKTTNIVDLPFINANENQLIKSIVDVKVITTASFLHGQAEGKIFTQIIRQPHQKLYRVQKSNLIQILKLFERLKQNQIQCLIGFGQLSIDNNQIIITKTPNGFHIEGTYGQQFDKVRRILKECEL